MRNLLDRIEFKFKLVGHPEFPRDPLATTVKRDSRTISANPGEILVATRTANVHRQVSVDPRYLQSIGPPKNSLMVILDGEHAGKLAVVCDWPENRERNVEAYLHLDESERQNGEEALQVVELPPDFLTATMLKTTASKPRANQRSSQKGKGKKKAQS